MAGPRAFPARPPPFELFHGAKLPCLVGRWLHRCFAAFVGRAGWGAHDFTLFRGLCAWAEGIAFRLTALAPLLIDYLLNISYVLGMEIRTTEVYQKWFDKLVDVRAKARIRVRIRRLEKGNPGDVKPVGDGISEIRIDYGQGYRLYYKDAGKEIVILLCGGDKSTQQADIAKAKILAAAGMS
jgi:putative addiction module killer protein